MRDNEAKLWRDIILPELHPGWNIAVSDLPECAQSTAAIYLVDTSSDWRLAGMFRPSNFLSMHEQILNGTIDGERISNAASLCILDDSAHARNAPDAAEHAIKLAIGALVQTRCYEIARSSPTGLNGHWIHLVYRMRDGSAVARPAMMPVQATPFPLLPPARLEAAIQSIVRADTTANINSSSIARQLHQCGGAILADDVRADTPHDRPRFR